MMHAREGAQFVGPKLVVKDAKSWLAEFILKR